MSSSLKLSSADLMSFIDRRHGLIVGTTVSGPQREIAVLATRDGALNWTQARLPEEVVSDGHAHAVQWIDSTRAMLVLWRNNDLGSVLLETQDGGATWSRHPDATFQGQGKYISAVVFGSPERGALFYEDATGEQRFIARSQDGGKIWRTESFPFSVSDCQVFEHELLCSSGMNLLNIAL